MDAFARAPGGANTGRRDAGDAGASRIPSEARERTPLPRSGTGPLALLLAPYISLRVCSSPASRQRAPLCGTAKCSHLFRRRPLDFENLRFLLLQEGVHLRYVLMREILDPLEAFLFVVFRN